MFTADKVAIDILEDDAGERLADLHRWLRDDPDVGAVITRVSVPPGPGEMSGDIVEALTAAVVSRELLVALVSGLAGWLAARAPLRRTTIRVKRGEHEIEIDSANLPDPEEIAERLFSGMGETDSGAAT